MNGEHEQHEQMDDPFVAARLGELRKAMTEMHASPEVEHQVLAAFRHHAGAARRRRYREWTAWGSAAAGAAALLGFVLLYGTQTQVPPPRPIYARIERPPLTFSGHASVPVHAVVVRPRRVKKTPAPQVSMPAGTEVATDFLPLPFAPPLLPDDAGQVVRVRLPRSAMRTVGLPVNEDRIGDRVPADVLLGEDGFARAVRFVKLAR